MRSVTKSLVTHHHINLVYCEHHCKRPVKLLKVLLEKCLLNFCVLLNSVFSKTWILKKRRTSQKTKKLIFKEVTLFKVQN